MLDALIPFVAALDDAVTAGQPLAQAWPHAARVATDAAEATRALTPKVGRARPLAAKSVGTPDPGAVSLALCATAVGEVLAAADGPSQHNGEVLAAAEDPSQHNGEVLAAADGSSQHDVKQDGERA
jgi:hypothetical protein